MPIKKMLNIFGNFLINLTFCIIFFGMLIDDTLPDINSIKSLKRNIYIKIYDRKNNLIAKHGDIQERSIKIENLPKHLICAIVDVEDKKFFSHHGVDFLAILRSVVFNMISNRILSGGSSITQQLAKNLLQNEKIVKIYDKTLMRKVKEVLLAFKLEERYSKNEILTFYLNRIYFGAACYGIYSGSLAHFGKAPSQLNLYESAALVGLVQAPSRLSSNQDFWKTRTKKVLKSMLKRKHITQKQFEDFSKFQFPTKKSPSNVGYFTDLVISQIPDYLKTQDLIVKTTLDLPTQNKAFHAVKQTFEELGKEWNAQQGAFVVLDKNGAIKALVGGIDYQDSQFNRAIKAQRSAGSFFKYYIYLEAMKRGVNPESMISDKPITLGEWKPSNWLHQSVGKIKIKDAFAQSVNSSAIMLLLGCGIKHTISLVHKLGIESYIAENPSISIGGFNASITELANTMVPIINAGYKTKPYCIEEIYDASTNEVLYQHQHEFEKALDARTIWYAWQLLKYAVSPNGTARSIGMTMNYVGGKTGTSNDYKDVVFVGATPEYIFGAWFGRDDFKAMIRIPGKHLGVVACKYFLQQMPQIKEDLNIELGYNINTLSFEDLML